MYLKGQVSFAINRTMYDIGSLKQGIGISGEDLSEIRFCEISAVKKVITIENLTTFFRWVEPESLIIYLGGYHNSVRRALLKAVYEALPDAEYYHFGDMDAGGFEIYRDLCAKTKIPFQRYRMDLDTLVSHQRYGKELTENDRERLKKILEKNIGEAEDFCELIQYMLENNVKLEQECILEANPIELQKQDLEEQRAMSKYNSLWEYVKNDGRQSFKLTFEEIQNIAGIPIDHSFLKYKKELTEYGYQVGKISMKEQTVIFNRVG